MINCGAIDEVKQMRLELFIEKTRAYPRLFSHEHHVNGNRTRTAFVGLPHSTSPVNRVDYNYMGSRYGHCWKDEAFTWSESRYDLESVKYFNSSL